MQERKPFGPAFLPSPGLGNRRATLHVFDRIEAITRTTHDGRKIRGKAHMYRCTETDECRVWGFEAGGDGLLLGEN